MALSKHLTDFITNLYNSYKVTETVNKKDEGKSLELIIQEQRRDYDYLTSIYDRMRATENVLLTASFGIVTYLYYRAPAGSKSSIADRVFFPQEDYGKVIYIIAAGFFVFGIFKLMITVFGYNPWQTAYEREKTFSHNRLETLEYVKNRYDICLESNGKNYAKRKRELIFLFYCMLISAIILVVIKTLN